MARPQKTPQAAGQETDPPSLQVVDKAPPARPAAQAPAELKEISDDKASSDHEEAAHRRLHPPRVWPD